MNIISEGGKKKMTRTSRVTSCKKCGQEDLPERHDPLNIRFKGQQSVILYGMAFFYCEPCREFYFLKDGGELTELHHEIYKKATEGINTVIL